LYVYSSFSRFVLISFFTLTIYEVSKDYEAPCSALSPISSWGVLFFSEFRCQMPPLCVLFTSRDASTYTPVQNYM
jgi:hypothetical protein